MSREFYQHEHDAIDASDMSEQAKYEAHLNVERDEYVEYSDGADYDDRY